MIPQYSTQGVTKDFKATAETHRNFSSTSGNFRHDNNQSCL